jgi:hypothetical protein
MWQRIADVDAPRAVPKLKHKWQLAMPWSSALDPEQYLEQSRLTILNS